MRCAIGVGQWGLKRFWGVKVLKGFERLKVLKGFERF
jgi:hypothetical protein